MAHRLPDGQPEHPQPQDDFPFLLPRTMLATAAATTRTRTALMMIVAIFSISHVIIELPPVSMLQIEILLCTVEAAYRSYRQE